MVAIRAARPALGPLPRLVGALLVAAGGAADLDGAGGSVPAGFDCGMRKLALDFARRIIPGITQSQLQDLADALNGSPEAQCRNLTVEAGLAVPARRPPLAPTAGPTVFVSPEGDDTNPGTQEAPLRTLAAAARRARPAGTVELLQGVHREGLPLLLTAEDSGLTIRAADGQRAVVSGAVPLQLDWRSWPGAAGRPAPAGIWVADVPVGVDGVPGLRADGKRAVRARYPNSDPDATLMPEGRITAGTNWLPPLMTHKTNPPLEYVVDAPQWTRQDSAGNELQFQGGLGGPCYHFDPPFGYWCSAHPNRTDDGSLTHRWPSGLVYDGLLPNAPYGNATGAVVHACRGGDNCWFTWMFEVDKQSVEDKTLSWTVGGFQGAEGEDGGGWWFIENVLEELDAPNEFFYDAAARRLYYMPNATAGSPPISDLHFEATQLKVLLNVTGTPSAPAKDITISGLEFRDTAYTYMDPHGMPSGGDWALARTGALFFQGVEGVRVDGCRVTQVDGTGVFINGYSRNFTLSDSEFTWIGESAVAAWGYTKQGLGGGSIELPDGVGIDGTGGEQPQGTQIVGNIMHEVGLFQKQSSMYFQAQAYQTVIQNNLFYNGPRAHINFNDQFGGGNLIAENLILNACRETADHGPFNSWGRMPFITTVRDGSTPSIVPAVTEIRKNFIIGSYHTQETIDTDDASEYFDTHHNFFVYGETGLKSDFGGHDNSHHDNVYAYTQFNCMVVGSFAVGHEDAFYNNTCVVQTRLGYFADFDCDSAALPNTHDNRIFLPDGPDLSVCGKSFAQWQAEGHESGTGVFPLPSDSALLSLAASTLGMDTGIRVEEQVSQPDKLEYVVL